jgi:hypothetical protein
MSNWRWSFVFSCWRAFFCQSTPKFSDLGVKWSGIGPSHSRPLILDLPQPPHPRQRLAETSHRDELRALQN